MTADNPAGEPNTAVEPIDAQRIAAMDDATAG